MILFRILSLSCPRCGKGKLPAGLFKTASHCSACGMRFEKEQGYFAGAIYPLYAFSAVTGGLVSLLALFVFGCGVGLSVGLGGLAVILASPYLFWLSRSAFLHIEENFFKRMGA